MERVLAGAPHCYPSNTQHWSVSRFNNDADVACCASGIVPGGHPSPGCVQSGQHASNAYRQMPQHSSSTPHCHVATPCHRLIVTFIESLFASSHRKSNLNAIL